MIRIPRALAEKAFNADFSVYEMDVPPNNAESLVECWSDVKHVRAFGLERDEYDAFMATQKQADSDYYTAVTQCLGLPTDTDIDLVLSTLQLAVTKAVHLDAIISGAAFSEYYPFIYGSGEFLTDYLTPEIIYGDEDEFNEFLTSHACEFVEHWSASALCSAIEDAGTNHVCAMQKIASEYDTQQVNCT